MVTRPISDSAVERAARSIHQPRDPNTLSNYNAWRTKHTVANFDIDFDAKRLKGNVRLILDRLQDNEGKIVLDSR
jgi:leukotriene-A4 hydrolase